MRKRNAPLSPLAWPSGEGENEDASGGQIVHPFPLLENPLGVSFVVVSQPYARPESERESAIGI